MTRDLMLLLILCALCLISLRLADIGDTLRAAVTPCVCVSGASR